MPASSIHSSTNQVLPFHHPSNLGGNTKNYASTGGKKRSKKHHKKHRKSAKKNKTKRFFFF